MQNKTSPSLAIVIPVYNEAKVLPKALKSLQALLVDEIIFVDGGSADSTRAMIEGAGFVCLQSEAGRAKQMNLGTQKTLSDIILYLHIDTSINSSNILNIKKTYIEGFLSGRFDICFPNRLVTYRIISLFINIRSCLTKISTGDQGIFVSRATYDAVGGVPDIPLMEDVAFTKILRRHGKVICLHDKLETSCRRWENEGVIRTVLLMWKLRLYYWLGIAPEKLAAMYRDTR